MRQGQGRQRPDDSLGNTADDNFMRRGDDQDMSSSVPRRQQQQQQQQGFGGSGDYSTGAMSTGEGEYTTRPYKDVTTSPGLDIYGRDDNITTNAAGSGERFGTTGSSDGYNPAEKGTYDSERRRQPGVGGEARDEYGSGTSRGSSNPNPQAGGSVGGTGDGLGAVSGMDSSRRDDDAYGTSSGQQQPHKRKDSTFGKLMEKAGGVLGNKNLEEKGHQRRESAAGREKNM